MPDSILCSDFCRTCGAPLLPGLLAGQCPACIISLTFPGDEDTAAEEPGSRSFGSYELGEELGRGGMGVVYRAWEPRLKRTVALKLLLGGAFAAADTARRFRQEAEIAAGLRHPNLVQIYEAGEFEDQAFYAMELVEGRSLAALARGTPLPADTAARYLESVARAVQHAHTLGVLHRDLKPSNILIDAFDQPRVADFGLARPLASDSDITRSTDAIGSPPYMAPEQALGKAGQAGKAADVYSLGAVLYHALTGRPPFQGNSAAQILAQVERDAPLPPRRLNPAVPADLETVCLKCLEKDAARRYLSAGALADDLGRFLRREPVQARPVGALGKSIRWARRQPVVAGLLTALLTALAGGAAIGFRQAGHALQNADEARRARKEAENEALTARTNAYVGDMAAASAALRENSTARVLELLAAHEKESPDLRGFEWYYMRHAARGGAEAEWRTPHGKVNQLTVSPDGNTLLASCAAGVVLLDPADNKVRAVWPHGESGAYGLDFDDSGKRLLVCGGKLTSWLSWPEGRVLFSRAATEPEGFGVFMGESRSLDALRDGRVRWWNPGTGESDTLGDRARGSVTVSPDGRIAVTKGADNASRIVWDTSEWKELRRLSLPAGNFGIGWTDSAFSPDGRWVAAGCMEGKTAVWRTSDWERIALIPSGNLLPNIIIWTVAFSPDNQLLAAGCGDGTVRIWNTTDWQPAAPALTGHTEGVLTLTFSADGSKLWSGDFGGVVKRWSLPLTNRRSALPTESKILRIEDNGRRLLTAPLRTPGGSARIFYRLPAGGAMEETRVFPISETTPWTANRAGTRLLTIVPGEGGRLLQWFDLATAEPLASIPLPPDREISWLGLTPDQSEVLAGNADGRLEWRSAETLAVRHFLDGQHDAWIIADSHQFLATSRGTPAPGQTPGFDIRRAGDGIPVARLTGHAGILWSAYFSPDASLVASCNTDGRVRIWRWSDGAPVAVLRAQQQAVTHCAFSNDGRTLAAGGNDGTITLWHVPSRRFLGSIQPPGPAADIGPLLFSPGDEALSVIVDGTSQTFRILRGPR